MEFAAFRLTATQLAEVHKTVTQGKEHLWVSKVGVVVGLLARCLSEIEPESKPIDTIVNVVNVRSSNCNFLYNSINLIVAPRNGYIPAERSGQRGHMAPHRYPSLETCRYSRRRF